MSTIYILWLRQLKRYWRSKPRVIGALGQPIFLLTALGFGMRSVFERAGGGNYINFLTPGVICQGILFMAVFSGVELIWDRQFGFLKETLVAPVSRLEIVIGRTFGGATIATLQGVIIFFLSLLVGFRPNMAFFPLAVLLMFLIALFYTAVGTAIASLMRDFHGFQLVMNFLVAPSFYLSGALFPLESAPDALRTVSSLNLLTYGVDALRGILVGTAYFSLTVDILVLGVSTAIMLVVASYLFSKIQA